MQQVRSGVYEDRDAAWLNPMIASRRVPRACSRTGGRADDMSNFEFIFALFGQLLGLSLTEVLGGLARTIEARLRPGAVIRVGWLTPLMAAFVLLDLLSFWHAAWVTRGLAFVSGHSLIAVTRFASAYYLAAALVFPRDITAQSDLDDHFFRVRRIVIGTMLALLLCQLAWYASEPAMAVRLVRPVALSLTLLLAIQMLAAIFVRGARWSRVVMAALVARYVVLYLIF